MAIKKSRMIGFLVGFGAFSALHFGLWLFWDRLFAHHGVTEAWFLNSGKALLVMVLGLFLAGLGMGIFSAAFRGRWIGNTALMNLGVAFGIAVFLALAGPGNLWPLALILGTVATVPPIWAGVGLSIGLKGRVA